MISKKELDLISTAIGTHIGQLRKIQSESNDAAYAEELDHTIAEYALLHAKINE